MEKKNFEFTLDIESFREIPLHKYAKDFTFIVNNKHYQVPRILADLLSPTIRNYHFSDESINEFIINTHEMKSAAKEEESKDYFTEFIDIATRKNISIDEPRRVIYSEYFYALGNINEYLRIENGNTELTKDNVISRLQMIDKMTNTKTQEMSRMTKEIISFASEHFYELEEEEMKLLKIETLEEILSSDQLKINDEDSLLNFIISLYEKDITYSKLFDFVIFSNLSKDGLSRFIDKFDIYDIDTNIWKSICQRLISSTTESPIESDRYKRRIIPKEFKYSSNEPFNGIMKYLTTQSGSNIHDNGTIEITTNSINGDSNAYHPKNLVDYKNNNFYFSKDDGDANICFDFKDKLVQLKSYSIQSCNGSKDNCYHLRNWNIEISPDGEKWEAIDIHKEDPSVNGPSIIHNFNIESKENHFSRFIRLHQTGECWEKSGKHNQMGFVFIEFYGELIENKK